MAGGGRIKTRCSRFCFDASEHSSGTRGKRTGPLSKSKEQDEEWLLHVRRVFLQHPPAGHRSTRVRASRAPRTSTAPALPSWAGVCDRDKRALLEGEEAGGWKERGEAIGRL